MRALSRISLKDRKRMVDTIRKERPSVIAKIAQTKFVPPSTPAAAWLATTIDTRMPAAPGMGRPTMYLPGLVGLPCSPIVSTLKRASRIAPHAMKMNAAMSPGGTRTPTSSCRSVHW